MENLTRPIIGLLFLQRNHTVLDMIPGILNFPFLSMQLKSAEIRYSKVLEPILNSHEITIPRHDRVLRRANSLLCPENAVKGILQPSDRLNEEGDITLCPALVKLNEGNNQLPVDNFTDHPYKLKKGLNIAKFSVMTPEQMNMSNRLTQWKTGIYYKMTRSQRPTTLAVSSRQTNLRKTLTIIDFLLRRILETPPNIRLPRTNST